MALRLGKTARKSSEASAGALVLAAVIAVITLFDPEFNGVPVAISAVIIGAMNFVLKWIADWVRHRG